MTQPSVGRVVHFFSEAVAARNPGQPSYGFNGVGAGPYPALVTQVFKDAKGAVTYLNLKVFPPFAPPFDEGSVSEGAEACPGRYWTWPAKVEAK
jgi:hypothetical protein